MQSSMVRFFYICALLWVSLAAYGHELPGAVEVLKRVQARMDLVYGDSPTNRFHYTRTNVIEELDGAAILGFAAPRTF